MTRQILSDTLLLRKHDQIFSEVDGEIVMLNIRNSEYYNLNSVASQIWNCLETSKSFSHLVNELVSIYDVDIDECQKDIRPLLTEMLEIGIVYIDD